MFIDFDYPHETKQSLDSKLYTVYQTTDYEIPRTQDSEYNRNDYVKLNCELLHHYLLTEDEAYIDRMKRANVS